MSSQKHICLLCCKSFENSVKTLVSTSHNDLIETLVIKRIQKLFKSIGRRYLSARLFEYSDFKILKGDDVDNFGENLPSTGICSDCEIVACAICDLHHEIKCLELRLEWRIDTLEGIMKLGGRVPSRLEHLKGHCDEIDRGLKKEVNVSYTKITSVRRKLMKACSSRRSKIFPKIILHKYVEHNSVANSIPAENHQPINEDSEEHDEKTVNDFTDTIRKIMSLVIVIVIGLTTDIRNPTKFDTADAAISADQLNDFNGKTEDGESESLQSIVSTMPVAEDMQNDDDDCTGDESTEKNCGLKQLRRIIPCKHCPKTFSNSRSFDFHIKQCFGESGEDGVPDCEDVGETHKSDIEDYIEKFSPVESSNEASDSDSETSANHDSINVDASLSAVSGESQPPLSSTARSKLGDQGLVKCNFCPGEKYFREGNGLLIHMQKIHKSTVSKTYRCRTCQKIFSKKELLELHRLSCVKDRSKKSPKYFLTCKLCPGSRFNYPGTLRKHQRGMHGVNHDKDHSPQDSHRLTVDSEMVIEDEPLPCEVTGCQQRFTLPQELENHSKMHGQFSCSKCSVVMTFAPDLAQHEADEHPQSENATTSTTKFQCPRCTFTLNSRLERGKMTFTKHFLSTHLNLNWATLICAICGFRYFATNRKQRRVWQINHFKNFHDVSHMNPVDVHKCDQCPANFKIVSAMNRHKKMIHAMKLNCGECGREFTKRYDRRMHLLNVHKTQFSYSCSIQGCPHKFPYQDDLSSHIEKVHNHETPNGELRTFKCRQCGHLSKGKLEHMKHIMGHKTRKMREKVTFVCEQCGKAFKAKEKLQKHHLSHSGPDSWQFCCEICGRKFTTKYKLSEHGRTHTKDKPFQCSVCGEKYAHRHNLRNHVNKKHGDVVQDIPRRIDKSNLTSRKGTQKSNIK